MHAPSLFLSSDLDLLVLFLLALNCSLLLSVSVLGCYSDWRLDSKVSSDLCDSLRG